MTVFATAKPEPKWLKERRAEQAAARSRAARPTTCARCGAGTLTGPGEDHLTDHVSVDASPLLPGRRTLLVVVAVLSDVPIYIRQHGALHLADRAGLGIGPGDLALGAVREPVGPRLPLFVEHRCAGPP